MLSFTAPDSSGVFRWSSFDLSYSFSVLWPKRSFKNVKGSWTPLCLPAALEAKAQCLNVATAPRGPPSPAFCLSPGSLLLVRKPKGPPPARCFLLPLPISELKVASSHFIEVGAALHGTLPFAVLPSPANSCFQIPAQAPLARACGPPPEFSVA